MSEKRKGKILLFGFESLMQILALQGAVAPLNIELVPVARGDYNQHLEDLAGLNPTEEPAMPYAGGPLGGRMLVLCGVEEQLDELLPALHKGGAGSECLKAVLTPTNRTWTPLRLYTELSTERQAFNRKK